MKQDIVIKTLIVEESPNDAEAYANALRNVGLAIRTSRVQQAADLEAQLTTENFDLILVNGETSTLKVEVVLMLYQKLKLTTPMLVIASAFDKNLLINAMRAGGSDLVIKKNLDHLQLAVLREVKALQNVRTLQRLQTQMKESEQRNRQLMESSRDAITYAHEGMYIYANPAYLGMFGYMDISDLEGVPLLDMVASSESKRFKEFLRQQGRDPSQVKTIEVQARHSDGKTFAATMEFSPATMDGEPCTQIIIRDQGNKRELEEKLQNLASKDVLTGLLNRQRFLQLLQQDISAGSIAEKNGSLFYIFIDNLEEITAKQGISVRDKVLVELAEFFQSKVPDSCLLSHFADEVFTVYSQGKKQQDVLEFADKLCKSIAGYSFKTLDAFVTTTASIGVAFTSKYLATAEELVNQADKVSRESHTQGGNRITAYDPLKAIQQVSDEEKRYTDLLRYALDNDLFHLSYQPLLSLQGATGEHYEVLLRMQDDKGTSISPHKFITAAKESGLIQNIDRWVIKKALQTLAEQRQATGKDFRFFVRVSGASLNEPAVILWIYDCFKESKLKPENVIFQITEEEVRNNLQNAKKFIDALRKIKCKLAITHFKLSKYSDSLLKNLGVDFVKLDSSCVENLGSSKEKQAELKLINELTHGFNLSNIVPFVQDANTLSSLWTVGVDYVQGNFLQPPLDGLTYDFSSFY